MHISHNSLVFKICKELLQLNRNKKQHNFKKKVIKGFEETFYQRIYANDQKNTEKMINFISH